MTLTKSQTPYIQRAVNAIGSENTNTGVITYATLTAAYSGNTVTLDTKFLRNALVEVYYIPKTGETNRYCQVLIQAINGHVNNPSDQSVIEQSTAETLVHAPMPYTIPSGKDGAGDVLYSPNFSLNFTGDKIKISAKENGGANFGQVFIRLVLANSALSYN